MRANTSCTPIALVIVGVIIIGAAPAYAAGQILLSGSVLKKCSITATADPNAANLPIAAPGAHRLTIGTVLQDCNGRTGYTVTVLSTNCLTAPTGGKVIDPVSAEYLRYSIESDNPTTGGSAPVVTGLLAAVCTNQVARSVTSAIVHNETSTLFINFSGSAVLSAGTYQDTLTVVMTAK